MIMIRIGIIGTENSHALAFSQAINLPDPETKEMRFPVARVVGVMGPADSVKQITEECGVDFIAHKPEDFFGKADAMIITNRKGSLHFENAAPFIEMGLPLFVDKPITSDPASARELMAKAKASGSLVCGGSGCKLAADIGELKSKVQELCGRGEFITASMNFPADTASEYDGFYFYASHLTEMALTVYGYSPESVSAFEKNGSVTAVLHYPEYDITLFYSKEAQERGSVIYCKERNYVSTIDISDIYFLEVKEYIGMIESGRMPQSYEELVKPVEVIDAILRSVKTGATVQL